MRVKLFTLLAICSLLVASICLSIVQAQELRFGGANAGEYWLFVDRSLDSLNYKEHLEDKLKLSMNYGDLTLGGVFFMWNPSQPNPNHLNYIDYNIDYNNELIDILFGTYYSTFGRGLVLNQFLDEDFKQDNSIYGIMGKFDYFNSELSILAGRPRNIFFEQNSYKIKNDSTDQIRGIDFNTNLVPKVNLGARYVRVNRSIDLTPKAFTELFGGNAGVNIGAYQGYLEYARQLGCYPVIGGRLTGTGILFTSSLSLSGFGATVQFMDYDSIGAGGSGYRYNEPPTPIKSGISVNRGTDEIGYGISLNYSPMDNLNVELSDNKITTHDYSLNKFKQIFIVNNTMQGVTEQIVKVKANPNPNLEILGTVERLLKQQIELPIQKKTETKPYLSTTYNFGQFFVEGEYEINFISADTSRYFDNSLTLSVGKSEHFTFTVRYQIRNRTPDWLVALKKIGPEKTWPMAELSLDLTSKQNLRIRVGAEQGGLVCSGGVCRFEEPFKGVKVVLTSLF